MSRYSVAPLVMVGFEGLFGALTILIFMPVLAQFADKSMFFDLPRGWHQMVDNPTVLWSGVVIAISISLFNFFGLSVTRHVSATARSLTDTCRTLSIWLVSLTLGWERLLWPISLLQVLGFSLLVYVPPYCLSHFKRRDVDHYYSSLPSLPSINIIFVGIKLWDCESCQSFFLFFTR